MILIVMTCAYPYRMFAMWVAACCKAALRLTYCAADNCHRQQNLERQCRHPAHHLHGQQHNVCLCKSTDLLKMCSMQYKCTLRHLLMHTTRFEGMHICCAQNLGPMNGCPFMAMETPFFRGSSAEQARKALSVTAHIEPHAKFCGHAAGNSRTRESMPAVCSSSTSVVLKTGYSHVLGMAPCTSRHACWAWLSCGATRTVHHVGVL